MVDMDAYAPNWRLIAPNWYEDYLGSSNPYKKHVILRRPVMRQHMVPDYEPILKAFDPKISFSPCSEEICESNNYAFSTGIVMVPSDYDDAVSKQIPIKVYRLLRKDAPTDNKIPHLIILAGGPGEVGNGEIFKCKVMLNTHDMACYVVHHRGLGGSAELYPNSKDFRKFTE